MNGGRAVAVATCFFVVVACLVTYPLVLQLRDGVYSHQDPLLSVWRLAWIAHQAPRNPWRLFDGNIFHPELRTLAMTDATLAPGLAAAPFLWLGCSPVLAYNVLMLGSMVLSAASMFILTRRLTGDALAAVVAGLAYGFAPFRVEHIQHLEMQVTFWIPLGLWALHRLVADGAIRDGALLGVCVAGQALSSLYFAIFFVTFLAPVTAVLALGAAHRAAACRALVVGALTAGVIIVPYAAPYIANTERVGVRPDHEIARYGAQPLSYLSVPTSNLLYGRTLGPLGGSERRWFPGITVIALVAIAVWPPFSLVRVAYVVAGLAAFDASLGLDGWLYPVLVAYVPGYRGLRAPARFGLFVQISLAVLAGFGAARWRERVQASRRAWIAAALVTTMVLEYSNRPMAFDVVDLAPTAAARYLQRTPPSVIVHFPLPPDADHMGDTTEALYMYDSTFHWHALLNGYSGFFPPSYRDSLVAMQSFPSDNAIAYLRRRRVDHIIVHSALYDPARYADLITWFAFRDDVFLIGAFPDRQGETRIYSLKRPTTRP